MERLAAECWKGFVLFLPRDLEVMTGNQLVAHQAGGEEEIALAQLRTVLVAVSDRVGGCRCLVEAERHRALEMRIETLHVLERLGEAGEVLRDVRRDLANVAREPRPFILGRAGEEARVRAQTGSELPLRPMESELVADLLHLSVDLRHLFETDPVDLHGREID